MSVEQPAVPRQPGRPHPFVPPSVGGDLPPVVEEFASPRRIVKWVSEPDAGVRAREAGYADEDVHDFRPTLRPPVPVVTVLDDGSMDHGEEFRLRTERLSIGRTSGDVRIPGDPSISGAHAEIRRVSWRGGFQWQLHDLDSVNGTFVRCVRAVLHENVLLILGARRFRVRNPLKPQAVPLPVGQTNLLDGRPLPPVVWPMLEETASRPGAEAFPLRDERLVVGRAGGGADIELDDPLLANRHAELKRLRDGSWIITGEHTRNGIWVSVAAIGLAPHCYFRCGEQRFRFVIP
ncbi:MAG: FHA domain-containing protein [Planctomycetia bacterium]|nr:FHA domain-containing protein [Planctomycetia bacterium]